MERVGHRAGVRRRGGKRAGLGHGTAKRIAEERRFLSDGLAAYGLTVFPGEANFLLFRSNDTGLHEKLAEHGIMIRNCDNYRGLSAGYYRVAVKTREASERLLQIITNYTQCEV